MVWAEERRGKQFNNRQKQLNAIKKMKNAGLNSQTIINRWEEMENQDFWKNKGFDFMSVANDFDKKLC